MIMTGDTAMQVVFVLSLISVLVVTAFVVYPPLRDDLPFYDPVADWAGHGVPDIAMIYMAFVMASIMPELIPFDWCAVFFAVLSLVFVVRIWRERVGYTTWCSYVWWQDLLHLIGVLTKVYMFMSIRYWMVWLTLLVIFYFVGVIALYVIKTQESMQSTAGITIGRAAFNIGHITMAAGAILMFLVMQFPLSFPFLCGVGHVH